MLHARSMRMMMAYSQRSGSSSPEGALTMVQTHEECTVLIDAALGPWKDHARHRRRRMIAHICWLHPAKPVARHLNPVAHVAVMLLLEILSVYKRLL